MAWISIGMLAYLVLPTWAMLAAEAGGGSRRRYVQFAALGMIVCALLLPFLGSKLMVVGAIAVFVANAALVICGHIVGRKIGWY